MDITTFFQDYMVIPIAVICFCIGYIIKNTPLFERVANEFIPLICGLLGMVLGIWMGGFTIQAIAEGLVSGLAATGFHQVYSQYIEKKSSAEADEETAYSVIAGDGDTDGEE